MWPRRLITLGGGGAGESAVQDSACACVTTGGGDAAAASPPTGGSLCACVTVSGGLAGNLAACLCATRSGGTADAQVTCAALTASGGAATPRAACVCATVSGGGANVPTACVCATVSGGLAGGQVACRCATQGGGTATADISAATFANGYAARRRVVLEAMGDLTSATLTDFPQPIPGALLAGLFKDAAHGGRVQSSAGWDIRVETTAGAQVDHHLAAYDPTAGTPFLFARMQRTSASRQSLFIYYGKAALAATEADPAGTWSAALAARFWPSGADVKGNLSFATLSGVTTAGVAIAGLPGARLAAASYARFELSTGNALDGVGAVTNHYLAKWTAPFPAAGNGERVGGTVAGSADFSEFVDSGVLTTGWIPETATGSRGNQYNAASLTTAADVGAGNVHSWHFTHASNQDCAIFRDGVKLATTFSGTTQKTVGKIGIDGAENDSLGAGTGAQTTAIPGDYGPTVIYSMVPSPTWIAAYDRCLLDPLAWMGVGAEELPGDAAGSPVAMPALATVTALVPTDIDVAGSAFVPTGATAPVLSTVGTAADGGGPAHGSVTAASGKARLTEADTSVAITDRFGFTLSAGGKPLVPARSIVSVQPSIIVTSGYYKTPNIANKTGVPCGTRKAFTDAIAAFKAGTYSSATRYINITGDIGTSGTRGSPVDVDAGGTQAHPLVIAMAGAGSDTGWSSRPTIYNTNLQLLKQWTWLYGLQCQLLPSAAETWNVVAGGPTGCVSLKASNQYVTACRLMGSRGVTDDSGALPMNNHVVNFNRIEIKAQSSSANTGTSDDAWYMEFVPSNGNVLQDFVFAYNYVTNYAVQFQTNPPDFRTILMNPGKADLGRVASMGSEVAWNFIDAACSHVFEFKGSIGSIHHNHASQIGSASPYGGINTRGENCDGPTTGTRPIMFANRIEAQRWECNARNWDYVSNVHTGGNMHLFAYGLHPSEKDISGADGCHIVGHKGALIVGYSDFQTNNYTYGNLGDHGDVRFSASDPATTWKDTGGGAITWTGDPGTIKEAHPHIIESAIHRQSALLSGYTLGTAPTLSATTTGPGVSGKLWAG